MGPGRLRRFYPLFVLAALLHPGEVRGQARLAMEVRGGASIPAGAFTEGPRRGGELEAAPAFGLHFALRRNRWTGLYAGFSQLRFGCVDDGCREGGELVSTAWDLGGHLRFRPGPWGPWARLGVVFARVESELPPREGSGPPPASELGVGGEAGVGWRIRLADRLGLNPGVRYTRLDSRLDEDTVFRMRYWVADVGVVLGF